MAVFKIGNFWYYKFVFRGELVKVSTKQGNKRLAEQLESAHKARLLKEEAGIEQRIAPTVAEFAEQFKAYVRNTRSKESTVSFYVRHADALAHSCLGKVRLDRIDHGEQQKLIEAARRTLQVSSTNRLLATLRLMLNLAEQWKAITRAHKVKLLSGENRREYVLTSADEAAYLVAAEPLPYSLAVFMLDCGLRPEEFARLTWESIQGTAVEIYIGKGSGSRRRLELTERTLEVLARQPRTSPWVFPGNTKSGHIEQSTYRDGHDRAIRRAGIKPFVPYAFRHTCITRWARSGMPAAVLQKLAGHANIATTMRYIHMADTDATEWLKRSRVVLNSDQPLKPIL